MKWGNFEIRDETLIILAFYILIGLLVIFGIKS